MNTRAHAGTYLGKLTLSGVAFFAGTILGNAVAMLLGMPTPALPQGADPTVLNLLLVPVGLLAAFTLSLLARGLSGGFLARWFMLSTLTWIVYAVNTVIEGTVFTTLAAISLFTVVTFLGASLLCGAAVAWLFPPATRTHSFATSARAWAASHRAGAWLWRLGLAWLVFPLIYVTFGSLVAPFVIEVYRQQQFELTAPGWSTILITQAIRSVLFLVACLPILIAWQQSRRRLLLALGWALFVFVGLLYMLQAYWMPLGFRLAHSLEILADSLVYVWTLVVLFGPREDTAQRPTTAAEDLSRMAANREPATIIGTKEECYESSVHG